MDNFFRRNKRPLAFGIGVETKEGIEWIGIYINRNYTIAALLMIEYNVKQDNTSVIYPEEKVNSITRKFFTRKNADTCFGYNNLDKEIHLKGKAVLVFFFHECNLNISDKAVLSFRNTIKLLK